MRSRRPVGQPPDGELIALGVLALTLPAWALLLRYGLRPRPSRLRRLADGAHRAALAVLLS